MSFLSSPCKICRICARYREIRQRNISGLKNKGLSLHSKEFQALCFHSFFRTRHNCMFSHFALLFMFRGHWGFLFIHLSRTLSEMFDWAPHAQLKQTRLHVLVLDLGLRADLSRVDRLTFGGNECSMILFENCHKCSFCPITRRVAADLPVSSH